MIDTPNMCTASKPTCHSSAQTIKQASKKKTLSLSTPLWLNLLSLGFLDESFLSLAMHATHAPQTLTPPSDYDFITWPSIPYQARGQLIMLVVTSRVGDLLFLNPSSSALHRRRRSPTTLSDELWKKAHTVSVTSFPLKSRLFKSVQLVNRAGWVVSPNGRFADCCSVLESEYKTKIRWNGLFGETSLSVKRPPD